MLDQMAIYRINLDHRTDRWNECVSNQAQMGYGNINVARFPAVYQADFGTLGCSKSHLKVLTKFFAEDSQEYCMVLEDDFDFRMTAVEFQQKLWHIYNQGLKWDVLLLASTGLLGLPCPIPFLSGVFESLSSSGYVVRRSYLPQLLQCFANSVAHCERFRNLEPRTLVVSRFALDISWHSLQRTAGTWFIFRPGVGVQRAGYSDIEGRQMDYVDATMLPIRP